MRELSLFSGCGLGVYGTGLQTIAYCESNATRRAILIARMNDGSLPAAPIYPDVRSLDGVRFRDQADIVTGGFPCQAFSQAARGRNTAADLWPEMLRIIDECRAPHVFAENVKRAPIEHAATDLHARGYACRFARLDADAFGAPHRRTRWWIVAHADGHRESVVPVHDETPGLPPLEAVDRWDAAAWPLGVDDGGADRMDRLAALGDAQVPVVARAALAYLW